MMADEGMVQRVHIERATVKDLEHGIKELEKRGYELIKRDEEEFENKHFDYAGKHRQNHKYKYEGMSQTKKFKAVMQRIYYKNKGVAL